MERIQERLANLLSVKSLVTVTLTVIFAGLSVRGSVSTEQFSQVFTWSSPSILVPRPSAKVHLLATRHNKAQ